MSDEEDVVQYMAFDGVCPFLFCLKSGHHHHVVCDVCQAVRAGNLHCPRCAELRPLEDVMGGLADLTSRHPPWIRTDPESNTLHVDVLRLLESLGLPDAPEHREMATKAAHELYGPLMKLVLHEL